MKTLVLSTMIAVVGAFSAAGATETWTGKISDNMCGADHSKMASEHASGSAKVSDRDCTAACVKNGGKYVFVREGKVYNIANQDYAGLQQHAGHTVKLTGDMQGDSITVSNIVMPGKGKSKTTNQ